VFLFAIQFLSLTLFFFKRRMMGEVQRADGAKLLKDVCVAFYQLLHIVTVRLTELKLKIRVTNLMRNVTLSVYDN